MHFRQVKMKCKASVIQYTELCMGGQELKSIRYFLVCQTSKNTVTYIAANMYVYFYSYMHVLSVSRFKQPPNYFKKYYWLSNIVYVLLNISRSGKDCRLA